MKDYSKANRGKPFEDFLKFVHQQYQRKGIACVHKVPTEFIPIRNARGEVCNCKVEEKSCVDYLGRYRGTPVAIEAKHTEGNRISYSEVQPHQAAYLDDWILDPNAVALVVISFSLKRFFAVPWQFIRTPRKAWQEGKKFKIETTRYGMTWKSNGMASVSADELLPEWEIKAGGASGLPYLEIIDRMKGETEE